MIGDGRQHGQPRRMSSKCPLQISSEKVTAESWSQGERHQAHRLYTSRAALHHLKGSLAEDLLRTLVVRLTAAATGRTAAVARMLAVALDAMLLVRPLLPPCA